jgi:hypothetical protein
LLKGVRALQFLSIGWDFRSASNRPFVSAVIFMLDSFFTLSSRSAGAG